MRFFASIALTVFLAFGPAQAQDFKKGLAAYQVGGFDEALKEWRYLAERGHARAQHNIGLMYERGRGVPQDYVEALRWYRLAAEQKVSNAQFNLGGMYLDGRGVPQDDAAAARWYRLAAAQGVVEAQQLLAVIDGASKEGVLQNGAEVVKQPALAADPDGSAEPTFDWGILSFFLMGGGLLVLIGVIISNRDFFTNKNS